VERRGNHVGDHDKDKAVEIGRDGAVHDAIAEPGPEEDLAEKLEVAVPPCRATARGLTREEVRPGKDVEVEAAQGDDWVVEVGLVFDGEASDGVEGHDAIIVC